MLGHVCTGGGASIENSPIHVTLNVNIVQADGVQLESLVGRVLGMFGMGKKTIELEPINDAQDMSSDELAEALRARLD